MGGMKEVQMASNLADNWFQNLGTQMDWTKGAQMVLKKVGMTGTQMDWTKGAQMVLKKVGMRGTQM
eukprot:scaffold21470_cov42-Cyclotella_meneghiniana.AAC.2